MLHLKADQRRQNYALLQAIADAVGREFEARPYEELLHAAAELHLRREIDGIDVTVSAAITRRERDGTISVCVTVRADLPTPLGARPLYVFRKRPDESVF